jgi:hypothetical protein
LRIVLFGSSSSLTVRQRGNEFTVCKSEVVSQARLPCFRVFSCLPPLTKKLRSFSIYKKNGGRLPFAKKLRP